MKKELNGNAIKKFLKEKGFATKVTSGGGIQPMFTIQVIKSPYELWEKVERYNTMYNKEEIVEIPSQNYRNTRAFINKFIVDMGGRENSFFLKTK